MKIIQNPDNPDGLTPITYHNHVKKNSHVIRPSHRGMIARGATQICRATRREAPRGAARRQVSSESIVAIAIPKYGSTLQITSEHANLQMVQITCSFWDKNG